MATLRHLAAALLLLCSLYSTSADNNTQEVQRELETEEIEENFIIEDEFDNLFPGVLVQAKFEDVKTCWLETEFKEPCKSKKNDGNVGMTNITECVLEHECCYYRHPNRPEEPTCYQSRKVLGRMKNNQFGVYALDASVLIGDVTGYPSGVRPGPVITTTSNTYYYGTQRPTISIIKPKVQNYRFSYNSYIFTFHKVRRTYARARAECDSHATSTYGSMLLEITSEQTQKFINEKLKDWMSEYPTGGWDDDVFSVGYWIGGSDRDTEGSWKWDSGIEIPMTSSGSKYENWYKNKYYREPNNASPEDDCISMAATNRVGTNQNTLGKWFDANCASKRYYICMSGSKVRQAGGVYSISRSSCAPNTCANGGRCYSTSSGSGFSCVCTSGYSGPRCRIPPPTRSTTLPPPLPTLTTCCSVPTYNRRPCGGYTGSRAPRSYCKQVLQCCYNDLTGACYEPRPGCRVLPPTARPTTTPVTQAPTTRPPSGGFWLKWSGWSVCSRSCGEGRWTRIRGCMNGEPGKGGCIGQAVDTSNCNERQCDRGTWGVWGEWSGCSADCGVGISFRLRTCVTNSDTDLPCVGDSREQRQCETGRPCVASWASWGSWGSCSVTCGSGSFRRSRKCIGGNAGEGGCVGSGIDVIPCESIPPCPVTTWGAWTEYSQCDVTCGKGSYRRTRICSNGNIGDQGCTPAVDAEEVAECFASIPTCSFWAQWTDYGVCSADCGGGIQTRTRECIGGSGCIGDSQEFRTCNNQACASWESWSSWSSCNQDCGTGITKRTRKCIGGEAGGPGCEGSDLEETTCNTQDCAAWSEWSDYSQCSSDCGGGRSVRTRECLGGEVGDVGCLGPAIDERDCNTRECESWTEWGSWSDCSADCDGGITTRTRTCKNGFAGLGNCQGNSEDVETCNTQTCSEWGSWSDGECSVTCGDGILIRVRECIGGIAGISDGCLGDSRVEMECNEGECESWSEWSFWSDCSSSCGQGTVIRTRECMFGTRGMPGCIGEMMETDECDPDFVRPCPTWEGWGEWSECSESCGTGTRMRARVCLYGEEGEIGCIGSATFSENCNSRSCPTWAPWDTWGDCSARCNGGTQTRSRQCSYGVPGEQGCLGPPTQPRRCNEIECATWSEWSQYEECSKSCDAGIQVRTRLCIGGEEGQPGCEGSATQSSVCSDFECPGWGSWEEYSICTVTCGGGFRTRVRECVNGLIGLPGCQVGGDQESVECNAQNCPRWDEWSGWDVCSVTCGGGEQIRRRNCFYGVVGDIGCEGAPEEYRTCNGQICPSWREWTSWTECQYSCGDQGTRRRTRSCAFGSAGDLGCVGAEFEDEACNRIPCPRLTEWNQWSGCSETCGGGVRERTRECSYGTFEDFGCIADDREEEACNEYECRSWTPWSFVGLCSVTCNIGTRTRFRLCVGGEPGQRGCEGLDQDMVSCNEGSCPSWTPWGSWVECSASCDGGYQERTRACVNGDIGDPGCNDEESELRECNVDKCEQPEELDCDMLDLALIIDSSSSIKTRNFEIVRRFLRQIVRRLKLGEDHTRLAALRYNRDVDLLFNFADKLNTDEALREITDMRYDGSGTFTGQALEYAAKNIFGDPDQNRATVPDLAIVLTDGKAQDFPETSVQELKTLGVKVVVIGVTDQIVESELNAIATDPDSENVLLVGDFAALLEVVSDVTRFACRMADWSTWTIYSACDVTCGRGRQVRTRVCTDGFAILDECVGIDSEAKACNAGPCPRWSEWSFEGPCPVTCGGGFITRTRMCMFGATGVSGCEGEETASEPCATEPCPRWEEWSFWTECDASCGGGAQSRSRFCVGGEAGIRGCYGARTSTRLCNAEPCSRWLEWSLWSICTRDCDGGIRTRSRICLHGVPGDSNCFGDDYQTQGCNSRVHDKIIRLGRANPLLVFIFISVLLFSNTNTNIDILFVLFCFDKIKMHVFVPFF